MSSSSRPWILDLRCAASFISPFRCFTELRKPDVRCRKFGQTQKMAIGIFVQIVRKYLYEIWPQDDLQSLRRKYLYEIWAQDDLRSLRRKYLNEIWAQGNLSSVHPISKKNNKLMVGKGSRRLRYLRGFHDSFPLEHELTFETTHKNLIVVNIRVWDLYQWRRQNDLELWNMNWNSEHLGWPRPTEYRCVFGQNIYISGLWQRNIYICLSLL